MQKIIPFLWFNGNGEEAVDFYASVFKNFKKGKMIRYTKESSKAAGIPEGEPLTIEFEIFGQKFVALNAGDEFHFTEAVSFAINCDTQEEIDYYWDKLSEGGEESVCGWLKDKFGLSWQITPRIWPELMGGPDKEGAARAMEAMLKMKKLDIEVLTRAYKHE